jgi:hypothetical protein
MLPAEPATQVMAVELVRDGGRTLLHPTTS